MKDLELLNVMTQIRHVFGSESFIWEVRGRVSDMQECGGAAEETHGRERAGSLQLT